MSTLNPGPLNLPKPQAPETWPLLLRVASFFGRPLERFLQIQAASGLLLLASATIALTWANSPWAESYFDLWHTPLGIRVGDFTFERPLEWVVNDGLMVIFFFVVGLEIRREIHEGELSQWKRAAVPVAAALGGMVAPALIYLALTSDPTARSGWGVPMATDIAFAVGILTLLGKRVPAALRVLLLALAVIDDLGAILVIALFYSSGIVWTGIGVAVLGAMAVLGLQGLGVRFKLAYVIPGLVLWAGTYMANIHPTIAGVIIGLLTPVRAMVGPAGFWQGLERIVANHTHLREVLAYVNVLRREALSPTEALIERLHPWVAFGVMPIFALANAGVTVGDETVAAASWGVAIAVALGLIVGKPFGILLACWLAVKTGLGSLPRGLTPRHLLVMGVVAGIGFTMALFIGRLAFEDPAHLATAKLGVLIGSGIAAVLGLGLGRLLLSDEPVAGAALTADEAESSTVL